MPDPSTPAAVFEKDIFISYSTKDSRIAEEFKRMLVDSGVEFWIDEIDIGWGENILNKVFSGIYASKYVVVFVSDNSLASNWVRQEITTAFHREIE